MLHLAIHLNPLGQIGQTSFYTPFTLTMAFEYFKFDVFASNIGSFIMLLHTYLKLTVSFIWDKDSRVD